MDELSILKNIGPISSKKLNNLGITTLYLGKLKDIDFITLPIFDKEYIDKYISEYINKMLISSNKINNEYRNKNNILVHCIAGINRSASVIATYLMMYQKYTYNDAIILLENVNKKRFLPVIANRAFRDMLKHIEKNLKFKNENQKKNYLCINLTLI